MKVYKLIAKNKKWFGEVLFAAFDDVEANNFKRNYEKDSYDDERVFSDPVLVDDLECRTYYCKLLFDHVHYVPDYYRE